MRTITAIGHGPGGLGGVWRPMAWMPAIEVVRDRLAALAAAEPIRVVTTLDAGFPLMVAAAALLARDEGAAVTLEVVLAHPLPEDDREPRAIFSWARRALARADGTKVLFPREPRNRLETQAATDEVARHLLAPADLVLACWNGRRGNRTWAALHRARGLEVENLYPEIARALRVPARDLAGVEGVG